MRKITENLFIGNDQDCINNRFNFSIIHACKTCHQKGVGYRGNLPQTHPHYLIYRKPNDLYLNLVDMDKELMAKYTDPIFKSAIQFIDEKISTKKVLIHCNKGQSRSPAIGMVYLALKGKISSGSYKEAKREFSRLYQGFFPGTGIELYLYHRWNEIMTIKI